MVWTKDALSRYSVIFLRHFVVGKNNGGRVSFQTKFAQQVSCLSIVVVYIVLCSEMYNCTRKIASLEPSADQDNSRSISGALQACFVFHDIFSPLLMRKLVFSLSWSYLKSQLRPKEGNDFARATDWYSDVDQSRSSEQVKKKRPGPATRWSAPRPRVSLPPFSIAKNRHKNTE